MPPKKKAGTRAAEAAPAPKTARAETSAKPRVKVDDYLPWGKAGTQVYQEDGINWGVMLNQTDVKNNANKFYVIQLVERAGKYMTFTRWGRVGESGQNAAFDCNTNLNDAKKHFNQKFKDKTKNDWEKVKTAPDSFKPASGKYTLVDVALEDEAAGAVVADESGKVVQTKSSTLPPTVQKMLQIIFDKDMFKTQMAELKLDANKMPLGKLSKTQVQKGYDALGELEKAVKAGASVSKLQDLTSAFYSVIPHDFGRSVPPTIRTEDEVSKKYELLNVLSDIQVAVAVDAAAEGGEASEHPLDKQYRELACALEHVDPSSEEFQIIETYTKNTQGYRKCTIQEVFRVDRPEDKKRMQAHAKQDNRHLLWHGTNIAVVAAILKTGLRLMPHSGGRVGRGLYFASENGKSAGYVRADPTSRVGYMFLCEIVMGDAKEINQDDSSLCYEKVRGMKVDSIIARGRQEPDPKQDTSIPGEWGVIRVPQGTPVPQPKWSKSTFSQSEWLVYEESRVRIKYVLQMKFA